MEELCEMTYRIAGADPARIIYADPEPNTTRTKIVDCTRAIEDLDHDPQMSLEDGIYKTLEWMRYIYATGPQK
jgi:dTDP-glucose 4,6-dehydratase